MSQPLGNGAYGKVYKVEVDGKSYAEKKYTRAYCPSSIREIAFLRSAHHPNILKAVKASVKDGLPSVLLELCDRELEDYYYDSSSYPVLVKTFHTILCVLEYIHSKNLVHGDLTPYNILMKGEIVKLADFGMVRESGTHGVQVTTLPWRAPEALMVRHHSTAMDMWSFGVIAFEALTGSSFVKGKTSTEALNEILLQLGFPSDWKYRDRLSVIQQEFRPRAFDATKYCSSVESTEGLSELINGCLTFDEKKRLTATEALALPMFQGLERPVSSWEPTVIKSVSEAESEAVERLMSTLRILFPKTKESKLQKVLDLARAVSEKWEGRELSVKEIQACYYVGSALRDVDGGMRDWLEENDEGFKGWVEVERVIDAVDWRFYVETE